MRCACSVRLPGRQKATLRPYGRLRPLRETVDLTNSWPLVVFGWIGSYGHCSVNICVACKIVSYGSPRSSPARGGDVAVYVFDINQSSLPTRFYSVLVSVSVFTALSTVFRSINSPDNSPLSHSVLPVLCLLPYYLSLYESLLQPWCNPLWLTGLKAPTN